MAKIIQMFSENYYPREANSGDEPKTGIIQTFIRILKEAIAFSLEESDECDDLYDE